MLKNLYSSVSKKLAGLAVLLVLGMMLQDASACSRFTYNGLNGLVITGRSMDWMQDIHTDLWAMPAGIKREGAATDKPLVWVSKYGSVVASGYNVVATDGLNTQGLNANLLYLADAVYPEQNSTNKDLSVFNWVQFFLDNYATVDEAVKDFAQRKLNILAPTLPNGSAASVHLAITDPSGDNAIFEYVNGKLQIHHGKQYVVMTNEPVYDSQLALNAYWQSLDGKFLPGTGRPEDRYVRASYYVGDAEETADAAKGVATVFSIARNVSVPYRKKVSAASPNLAATLWVSVSDLTNKTYYFQPTDRPNIFWVNLDALSLNKGDPVTRLPLQNGQVYSGEVSKSFVVVKPASK